MHLFPTIFQHPKTTPTTYLEGSALPADPSKGCINMAHSRCIPTACWPWWVRRTYSVRLPLGAKGMRKSSILVPGNTTRWKNNVQEEALDKNWKSWNFEKIWTFLGTNRVIAKVIWDTAGRQRNLPGIIWDTAGRQKDLQIEYFGTRQHQFSEKLGRARDVGDSLTLQYGRIRI